MTVSRRAISMSHNYISQMKLKKLLVLTIRPLTACSSEKGGDVA